jgi:hypothetical protein
MMLILLQTEKAPQTAEKRFLKMTCKRFKRCSNYQLGRYECDHTGESCTEFVEKQQLGTIKEKRLAA